MIHSFRKKNGTYRWNELPLLAYKEEGTHFKSITRQTLFGEEQGLCSQWRYFEIAPGGHSTLERHRHVHGVMILRGRGKALVGKRVLRVKTLDLLYVPTLTWHQFRPTGKEPLGFLCLVNCERDRPERPDPKSLAQIRRQRDAAKFIRV